MEVLSEDATLRQLAMGGSMDYSTWPVLLTHIVSRIDKIARDVFPIPVIPPTPPRPARPEPRFLAPLPSSDPAEPPSTVTDSATSSQETNKENSAPTPPAAAPVPQATPAPAPPPLEPGTLPHQIVSQLAEISDVLSEKFSVYPPHTIQRLAELVLFPRQHYRFLPNFLHAVDRVVHVTSGANIYPLPPAVPDMSKMSALSLNGVAGNGRGAVFASSDVSPATMSINGARIGSDEALGGALLTPIPWLHERPGSGDQAASSPESSSPTTSDGGGLVLSAGQALGTAGQTNTQQQPQQQQSQRGPGRQFEGQVHTESTETIEGPNGVGSIETVSVSVNGIPSTGAGHVQQRALTQGEILRQEQRAGVVPVSQLARAGALAAGGGAAPPPNAQADDLGGGEAPSDAGAPAPSTSATDGETGAAIPENADEEMADEVPHARGPEEIGAADMGPQNATTSSFSVGAGGTVEMHGIDVEAAVGRRAEPAGANPQQQQQQQQEQQQPRSSPPPSAPEAQRQDGDEAAEDGEQQPQQQQPAVSAGEEQRTLLDGMETGPSSRTLTTSPSPAKREADDDLDRDSPSRKRVKESDEGRSEGAMSDEEDYVKIDKEDLESPPQGGGGGEEPGGGQAGATGGEETKGEGQEEQPKKDRDGDIVLSDQDPPPAEGETDPPTSGGRAEIAPGTNEGESSSAENAAAGVEGNAENGSGAQSL